MEKTQTKRRFHRRKRNDVMKVLITCRTCEHGYRGDGCTIGWCSNHEKYESVIPLGPAPVKRRSRNKTTKYIMTDEYFCERDFIL